MSRSRGPRVLRGLLAASIATFAALMSHLAGGGVLPGWLGIVVPWVLAVMICVALAGRTLSLVRLAVAVVLSQVLFHMLFVLGLFVPSTAPATPTHQHAHLVMSGSPALTGMMHSDAGMWVWHGVAAIATTALLYRGERSARRLRHLAAALTRAVRRRVAVILTPVAPAVRRPAVLSVARRVVAPLGWSPASLTRRGPPHLCVV